MVSISIYEYVIGYYDIFLNAAGCWIYYYYYYCYYYRNVQILRQALYDIHHHSMCLWSHNNYLQTSTKVILQCGCQKCGSLLSV